VALSGVRLQIITLLREHPKGLTPAEVQERLGCPKDLAPTIRSMARDGLLRRVAKGIYTAATAESSPLTPADLRALADVNYVTLSKIERGKMPQVSADPKGV